MKALGPTPITKKEAPEKAKLSMANQAATQSSIYYCVLQYQPLTLSNAMRVDEQELAHQKPQLHAPFPSSPSFFSSSPSSSTSSTCTPGCCGGGYRCTYTTRSSLSSGSSTQRPSYGLSTLCWRRKTEYDIIIIDTRNLLGVPMDDWKIGKTILSPRMRRRLWNMGCSILRPIEQTVLLLL